MVLPERIELSTSLSGLMAGAYAGYFFSAAQDILGGLPKGKIGALEFGQRNSPNNTTAEHKAVKGAFKANGIPAIAYALSALPDRGVMSNVLLSAAMQWGTSNQGATRFANLFAKKAPPRGSTDPFGGP
jgi:hypothetical protein